MHGSSGGLQHVVMDDGSDSRFYSGRVYFHAAQLCRIRTNLLFMCAPTYTAALKAQRYLAGVFARCWLCQLLWALADIAIIA